MGERAVRSMAASTSASTEARVPSTIWSTIGSTFAVLSNSQHQVGQAVHLEGEALLHHRRRAVLLDDGRAFGAEAGGEVVPAVHRVAGAPAVRTRRPARRRQLQTGPLYPPHAGDAPVHELDHVAAGRVAVRVAVGALVRRVETLDGDGRVERIGDTDGDLVRLAQVAHVHGAGQ